MLNLLSPLPMLDLAAKEGLFLFAPAAYIDPNTGGMLFQLLAVLFGVISGVLLLLSGRIKGAFYKIRRRMSGSDRDAGQQDSQDESIQGK
jgi:hypothetical protein